MVEKHIERHRGRKSRQKYTERRKLQRQNKKDIDNERERERDDGDYIGNENRQVRYASGAVVYYFSDDFVLAS